MKTFEELYHRERFLYYPDQTTKVKENKEGIALVEINYNKSVEVIPTKALGEWAWERFIKENLDILIDNDKTIDKNLRLAIIDFFKKENGDYLCFCYCNEYILMEIAYTCLGKEEVENRLRKLLESDEK